jgi:hypothetical protein
MTVMITSNERQQKILKEMHECTVGGHEGIKRTYDRLKMHVTWTGMFQDVEDYIRKRAVCQKYKFT